MRVKLPFKTAITSFLGVNWIPFRSLSRKMFVQTSKLRLLLYSNDDSLLMSAHKTFMTTNPTGFSAYIRFDEYRNSALACFPDLFLLTEAVRMRFITSRTREGMEPWKLWFDFRNSETGIDCHATTWSKREDRNVDLAFVISSVINRNPTHFRLQSFQAETLPLWTRAQSISIIVRTLTKPSRTRLMLGFRVHSKASFTRLVINKSSARRDFHTSPSAFPKTNLEMCSTTAENSFPLWSDFGSSASSLHYWFAPVSLAASNRATEKLFLPSFSPTASCAE